MKELVIISGKGGTGKTTLTASFAFLAGDNVLADCDVDAADLHILAHPRVTHEEDFFGGVKARSLRSRQRADVRASRGSEYQSTECQSPERREKGAATTPTRKPPLLPR